MFWIGTWSDLRITCLKRKRMMNSCWMCQMCGPCTQDCHHRSRTVASLRPSAFHRCSSSYDRCLTDISTDVSVLQTRIIRTGIALQTHLLSLTSFTLEFLALLSGSFLGSTLFVLLTATLVSLYNVYSRYQVDLRAESYRRFSLLDCPFQRTVSPVARSLFLCSP